MKKQLLFILSLLLTLSLSAQELYKNTKAPIEKRVEDLLGRMTLEEKVGQMNQFVGLEYLKENRANINGGDALNKNENVYYPSVSLDQIAQWTSQGIIGSYLQIFTVEEANYLQTLAMKSRLKIPILFGIDAIHGNAMCANNTVYPTNIGMACSFDTDMAYKVARQTAEEMRATNLHWAFNPNVEVARDARWGRVGETYGEDPYLVSLMGAATVCGYQRNLNTNQDVLACIKHFVAGSEPLCGKNVSPADLSERTLREVFFPPFKKGVDAGALSLMVAHNELNGIPCHSNSWLMENVLRKEWKFQGFIVSDWMDVEHLYEVHHTAENLKEAYYQAIMNGLDMHMQGIHWQEMVTELVKEGRIPMSRIDESVRRILMTKFKLGLFEHPYANAKDVKKVCMSAEHMNTALEAARNSIVLLKNDGILPLQADKYKRVLVTGINADSQNILGDWSLEQGDKVSTVLKGLRQVAPNTEFDFVDQGINPKTMTAERVNEAVEHAKNCDLNIVVAGEYMIRAHWNDRSDGENSDRSDLNLVGLQEELIEKLAATGKPTILILINGRPMSTEWAANNLPALVEAWAPGICGGQAIAEILYGKVNPSAKLAITVPRTVGQIQMIYNKKPSADYHPFVCSNDTPLFPFGFGKSYTTYEYKNLKLDASTTSRTGTVTATVEITNTGNQEGVEIAQLYIHDKYSSVTRPVKELKDFSRVSLKPGETKEVSFRITPDKLAFYDQQMNYIVEPGEFEVLVGSSSADKDLLKQTFTVK